MTTSFKLDNLGRHKDVTTDKKRKSTATVGENVMDAQLAVMEYLMAEGYSVPEAVYQMTAATMGACYVLRAKVDRKEKAEKDAPKRPVHRRRPR